VTDRHHKVQENINQMEEMNHYWFMGGGGGRGPQWHLPPNI